MGRAIRTVVGANFVFVAIIVFVAIGYGLVRGLPLDREFLGFHSSHRGPAWMGPVFVEGFYMFLFCTRRERMFPRGTNEFYLRLFGGGIGAMGLIFLLLVPSLQAQVGGEAPVWNFQRAFAVYLFGSHFLYGLIGTVRDESVPDFSALATSRRTSAVEPVSGPRALAARIASEEPAPARPDPEAAMRRFAYAEEFARSQGKIRWKNMIVVTLVLVAIGCGVMIVQGGSVRALWSPAGFRGLQLLLALSLMPILFSVAMAKRTRAVCPACRNNILLCPAARCHICGEPLSGDRCERCAVDETGLAMFRSRADSVGNRAKITYCPACGVWLNSSFHRVFR